MQLRAAGTNLKEGGWCCAVFGAVDGPKKIMIVLVLVLEHLEGSRFGSCL
jgi:hypothetical protein